MHPVALFPCCLVYAVRRYHLQGCHESGRFWVHYVELVLQQGCPFGGGGPMQSIHRRGSEVMSECCKVGYSPTLARAHVHKFNVQGTGVFRGPMQRVLLNGS